MNQIIKRLQSPTPIFFKRLRQITLTIGSIAVVVVAAEKMGWEAPDWVTWILNNYTAIGTLVTAFVSQFFYKPQGWF